MNWAALSVVAGVLVIAGHAPVPVGALIVSAMVMLYYKS